MTDYMAKLAELRSNPAFTDWESWETADGHKAITVYYNMYYAEEYIYDAKTGDLLEFNTLTAK